METQGIWYFVGIRLNTWFKWLLLFFCKYIFMSKNLFLFYGQLDTSSILYLKCNPYVKCFAINQYISAWDIHMHYNGSIYFLNPTSVCNIAG